MQEPPSVPIPDGDLAERILQGDRAAEEAFAVRFGGRVRSMMIARTGSRETADDLAQGTLLACLGALRAG